MIINIITNVAFNYVSGKDYLFEKVCLPTQTLVIYLLFPIILECNPITAAL